MGCRRARDSGGGEGSSDAEPGSAWPGLGFAPQVIKFDVTKDSHIGDFGMASLAQGDTAILHYSLTVTVCPSLGIHIVILLSSLSCSVAMTSVALG